MGSLSPPKRKKIGKTKRGQGNEDHGVWRTVIVSSGVYVEVPTTSRVKLASPHLRRW